MTKFTSNEVLDTIGHIDFAILQYENLKCFCKDKRCAKFIIRGAYEDTEHVIALTLSEFERYSKRVDSIVEAYSDECDVVGSVVIFGGKIFNNVYRVTIPLTVFIQRVLPREEDIISIMNLCVVGTDTPIAANAKLHCPFIYKGNNIDRYFVKGNKTYGKYSDNVSVYGLLLDSPDQEAGKINAITTPRGKKFSLFGKMRKLFVRNV